MLFPCLVLHYCLDDEKLHEQSNNKSAMHNKRFKLEGNMMTFLKGKWMQIIMFLIFWKIVGAISCIWFINTFSNLGSCGHMKKVHVSHEVGTLKMLPFIAFFNGSSSSCISPDRFTPPIKSGNHKLNQLWQCISTRLFITFKVHSWAKFMSLSHS